MNKRILWQTQFHHATVTREFKASLRFMNPFGQLKHGVDIWHAIKSAQYLLQQ